MNQTRFQMVNTPAAMNRNKVTAKALLDKFRWTADQKDYLNSVAQRGYVTASYNAVRKAFNQRTTPNGATKSIMVPNWDGRTKKSLTWFSL